MCCLLMLVTVLKMCDARLTPNLRLPSKLQSMATLLVGTKLYLYCYTAVGRRRNVQLLARPITTVPRDTNVRRLSTAASSIRYSASLGGSAMPAQHTRSTGLLCGRPVALELSTRQLETSRSWTGQLQTSAEGAIYLHCTEAFSILETFQDDML